MNSRLEGAEHHSLSDAWPAQREGWARGRGGLPQGALEKAEMIVLS